VKQKKRKKKLEKKKKKSRDYAVRFSRDVSNIVGIGGSMVEGT